LISTKIDKSKNCTYEPILKFGLLVNHKQPSSRENGGAKEQEERSRGKSLSPETL
jgi:hypothetical protein